MLYKFSLSAWTQQSQEIALYDTYMESIKDIPTTSDCLLFFALRSESQMWIQPPYEGE